MDGCSAHMWRERGSRKVANNCARCAKASKRGTAGLPCPAPALPHSTEHTKTGRLRGHANTWSLGMGAVTHCVLNHYACLLTSRAWRGTARPAVHQQWRMSIARVSCTQKTNDGHGHRARGLLRAIHVHHTCAAHVHVDIRTRGCSAAAGDGQQPAPPPPLTTQRSRLSAVQRQP